MLFRKVCHVQLLDVPLQLWSWIEIAFIHHSLGSILIAPMIFGFARLFLAAQLNIPSLARTVFVRGFCGSLFCFRNQLLRLLNLFGFLRIAEVSDLSSFTCVWHPWTCSTSVIQDVQFCARAVFLASGNLRRAATGGLAVDRR
jgi:hypothetical protein